VRVNGLHGNFFIVRRSSSIAHTSNQTEKDFSAQMIKHPRFKQHLEISIVDNNKLFIEAEESHFLIEDAETNLIARAIDGRTELDEIIASIAGSVPITSILSVVSRLNAGGHLVDGAALDDLRATAWWDRRGVNPIQASNQIASSSALIIDLTDGDGEHLSKSLLGAGVVSTLGTTESENQQSITIVVTFDHLDSRLAKIDQTMRESGKPWLIVCPSGETIKVGPLFVPGVTACWHCMEMRMRGNRQLDSYLERKRESTTSWHSVPPALDATKSIAFGIATSEVIAFLGGGDSTCRGQIITMDIASHTTERHVVIKRPQCPNCGDASISTPPSKIVLQPTPKGYTADGGHRVVRPEVTYERLIKHVSWLTGAVSSLKRQTINDDGVTYSYASGHNFALMQDSTFFLRKNLRGRSGGKGRTDVQAKVGAICEAIERYSGVFRGDEPRTRAKFVDLKNAIHPHELLSFSERQYETREEWNRNNLSTYHIVPERFDETLEIDWTEAWSLSNDSPRQVPTGYCYFGHPDIASHFFCASDANGNAAGNTLEEAILQGLLELVERDAAAVWWYNRLSLPEVDLDSFNEPYTATLREHYRQLGRSLWVLDLTTDLGIPVFAAVSRHERGPTEDILIGFGCHLDPHMAMMRSLTEVNQFLPAVCEKRPDGTTNYWIDDRDAVEFWMNATISSESYVLPDPTAAKTRAEHYSGLVSDDIAADVRACVEKIALAGHEVLVLNQTRPDLELSVVKVMSPGLRHFWRRLGKGRLYSAPVSMKRRTSQLSEDELNPRSIFF